MSAARRLVPAACVRGAPYVDRILTTAEPDQSVRDLLKQFGIGTPHWRLSVYPPPGLGGTPWTVTDIDEWGHREGEELTIERLGVLHGSTLTITWTPS
jgi:hypothetical protein